MKRVLVLCTGNSCRSQMAEALWEAFGEGQWESFSAGSRPSGYVHPLAVQAMGELTHHGKAFDLSAYRSKHVDQFAGQEFEVVVTVCDNAKEVCPAFPGAKETLHWPFDDPADAEGDEETKLAVFRRVRDEISERIQSYLR